MVNTFLTYNKIHGGTQGDNSRKCQHAGSTQPLLFSKLDSENTERPEWAWINGDDDE